MFHLANSRRAPPSLSSFRSLTKRGFDIAVATAGLLMLLPLIILVSLAIKVDSPGPILCRHKRYNSSDVELEIFAFRTRRVYQRETTSKLRSNKNRCFTRVGRVLHQSGIDRLPLLINVLCGEMSIVGTRLFTTPPGKAFRSLELSKVRPGLVTWMHANDDTYQIGETPDSIQRCIKYDLYYMNNCSFIFDMKILFHTILLKTTIYQDKN